MQTLVRTRRSSTGTVVVQVRGHIGAKATVPLRRALLSAIGHGTPTGHSAPSRLLLDLRFVEVLAPEGVGTLVAGCDVAGDRRIAVTVRMPLAATVVARRLQAAGIAGRCTVATALRVP